MKMSALISDLLRPVRDRVDTFPKEVQKSIRADVDRIRGLADDLEQRSAPSYAIFASQADDIFVVESLTHPVSSVSAVGPRPYLRPLRASPRPLRGGVLIADRTRARVFLATGDFIEEIEGSLTADIGKSNYGGFSGYDEFTVRSRAEEETSKMWKEAGSILMEAHLDHSLDYIAIGAADEMVEEIGRELHPYLEGLYRASFPSRPQAMTDVTLKMALLDLRSEVRRNRHIALAGRVCDTAWSGGLAVLGLGSVIDYSNAQAIETLVVAGPFLRPGLVCTEFGHVSRTGDDCPICFGSMSAIDDVVGAVMELVVEAGGDVFQIETASPLDVYGLGALTRFRIGD